MEEKEEKFEELLTRARKEKNLSHVEVLSKLKDRTLTEKDIRKWEIGLTYPDLDTMYELSAIYEIPINDMLDAKKRSCEKGIISTRMIKWICYFLNVSIHVAIVITIIIYILAIFLGFYIFRVGMNKLSRMLS